MSPLIISNDCTSGFIYKHSLNLEYSNPFVFSYIKISDFSNLIKSFKDINNMTYTLLYFKVYDNKVEEFMPIISYDNFKINFLHNCFSEITEDKIKELQNTYCTRKKRMHETPVFILNERKPIFINGLYYNDFNSLNIESFFNLKYDYKILFVTDKPEYKKYESDNIKVMLKSGDIEETILLSGNIYKELLKLNWLDYYNIDINIILNSCFGSDAFKKYFNKDYKYNNPFKWCRINPENFNKIINNFKIINFKNYKIIDVNRTIEKDKDNNLSLVVIYDDNIEVDYPHAGKDIEKLKYLLDKRINRFEDCINNNSKFIFWIEPYNETITAKEFESNIINVLNNGYKVIISYWKYDLERINALEIISKYKNDKNCLILERDTMLGESKNSYEDIKNFIIN